MFGWFKKSGDDFGDALFARLKKIPGVTVKRVGPLQFDVALDGGTMKFDGSNMAQIWKDAAPEVRAALLEDAAGSAVEGLTTRNLAEMSTASLMPSVRHQGYLGSLSETNLERLRNGVPAAEDEPGPWFMPLGGDLVMTVVEDLPNSMSTISAADLVTLEIDADDLLPLLLDNLASNIPAAEMEEVAQGVLRLTLSDAPWHVGSLLILPGLLTQIAEQFDSETLSVVFPNRDELYLSTATGDASVAALGEVLRGAVDRPYPQSELIWVWTDETGPLPVYQPDGEGGFAPIGGPDA